jgi:phytoene dehydrogenase-like protein
MNNEIAPPPELFAQWEDDILESRDNVDYVLDCAWRNGFQAGADQELEACCEWLDRQKLAKHECLIAYLRVARRPKPTNLKAQALAKLAAMERLWEASGNEPSDLVRRALEVLDD